METITFNRQNWSGSNDTVVINGNTFQTELFSGTFEEIESDMIKVVVDDFEHAPLIVIKNERHNDWTCGKSDFYMTENNPIVAALVVAHNLF